ncbi:hypothetical protein Tco_0133151 [Tanacetum coccineum]
MKKTKKRKQEEEITILYNFDGERMEKEGRSPPSPGIHGSQKRIRKKKICLMKREEKQQDIEKRNRKRCEEEDEKRYGNDVVYLLRVTKDKKYDYEGLCEFPKEELQQRFYAMFFKLPECELDVGLKIVECDFDSKAMYEFADAYGKIEMDEVTSKLRIHENRKNDDGNMSFKELVSRAEDEARHLKTPLKPKNYKQSNAPIRDLNVDDESSVPFELDDDHTGAPFEVVDDHIGPPSEAVDVTTRVL